MKLVTTALTTIVLTAFLGMVIMPQDMLFTLSVARGSYPELRGAPLAVLNLFHRIKRFSGDYPPIRRVIDLHEANENQDTWTFKVIGVLIAKGQDINEISDSEPGRGLTALHAAIAARDERLVAYLLSAGARPGVQTAPTSKNPGLTALAYARLLDGQEGSATSSLIGIIDQLKQEGATE